MIAARMAARPGDPEEVSDADWSVYESFKSSFEPPDEVPARHLVERDGVGDAEPIVAEVLDRLLRHE